MKFCMELILERVHFNINRPFFHLTQRKRWAGSSYLLEAAQPRLHHNNVEPTRMHSLHKNFKS